MCPPCCLYSALLSHGCMRAITARCFIGFVLCAVAAAVFFASVYRAVFFKVLIGADGFFIPAAVCTPAVFFVPRYFRLAGQFGAGSSSSAVCTFKTRELLDFFMLPADMQAAEYLSARVQAVAAFDSRADGERIMDGILLSSLRPLCFRTFWAPASLRLMHGCALRAPRRRLSIMPRAISVLRL